MWDEYEEQKKQDHYLKRAAEAIALAAMGPQGAKRILEWTHDVPEEPQDTLEDFWRNDKYFMYRPKPPEMPERWKNTPGPWARRA